MIIELCSYETKSSSSMRGEEKLKKMTTVKTINLNKHKMQKDPEVTDQPAPAISSIQLAVNRCTTYAPCARCLLLYTHALGQQETKQPREKTGDTAPHYSALLCSHSVRSPRELDVLSTFIDSETLTDEI